LADNNSIIYAGTKSKGVYKSTDNGSNWAQILSEVNTTIGDEPTKLITGIVVNPTNKNNIVVGDIHTGVYMSTDAGANWTNISQGLTNRAITSLAFSSDGKTLFTGTKGVGVFSYNTSTLAIDNYQTVSDIKNVFPNPSSGKFTLDLQSNSLKSLDVEIFSILGKLVHKKTYRATNKKIEINIEDLSKGMYIVSYQLLNGQKKSSKILIE
jgi:WD40 repeat protein